MKIILVQKKVFKSAYTSLKNLLKAMKSANFSCNTFQNVL